MFLERKTALAAACLGVLAWVNGYVCRDLFRIEYTGHTNSIQGLWITMARLAGEHWFRPSWWPFHDGGIPFEHTYMPLVPAATAIYAAVAHCSAARAFNALTALVYCLGPLTLFLMAWRLTRSPGYSFFAALALSLTSPARALLRDPKFDPSLLWTSRRLYTMTVWDDVPHQAALCVLPIAILYLWRLLENRRARDAILAGIAIAVTVLCSVFGAVAILIAAICMLAVFPPERLRVNAFLIAGTGAAAWLAISPFLPPSLIATIRTNQQLFPEDRWSFGSLTALSFVILGGVVIRHVSARWKWERAPRFFGLFAWVAACIPLIDTYWNRHFLPQPGRYQPEMEWGLALVAAFAVRPLAARFPREVRAALALLLLALAGEQLMSHRRYAKEIIRPKDMTRSIEFRVAQWVDRHMPGRRVMVPGSIAQWFNVFSTTPQLSGGSYSTTPNWRQQDAMTSVMAGKGPRETDLSILWLKAFGIQAVTVCGPNSAEFWKPYADPRKFEGRLPVLWQQDDVTIYRVPQRDESLAHVIPASALPGTEPGLPLGAAELERYVAALEDPSLPSAGMRWDGFRHASIRTAVRPGQVVSVQTNYHAGWHARAGGRTAAVTRDGLGFLAIRPACDGPCPIELEYDGGWEYRLCRMLSALTIAAVAAYAAFAYRESRRQARGMAPLPTPPVSR